VNTMVFSTLGWTKRQLDGQAAQWGRVARALGCHTPWRVLRQCWLVWALAMVCLLPARAADLPQLRLTRTAEGLFLSATVNVALAPSIEDALLRTVPLYFVVQADVLRERWYWSDKRVASASRTYRLAYQPLMRHWRVSVASGNGPGGALQYALHQNHDSLATALATITKLSGWQVAEAGRLEGETDLVLDFRFRLDLALLPRPFQLGMNAKNEWSLDVRQRTTVPGAAPLANTPAETAKEAKPDAILPSASPVPATKVP
jgi:hypothetical protein